MELYFKKVDIENKCVEVIDTAYPQYLFVYDDIQINDSEGTINLTCDTRVLINDGLTDFATLSDEELGLHSEKIMNHFLDQIENSGE